MSRDLVILLVVIFVIAGGLAHAVLRSPDGPEFPPAKAEDYDPLVDRPNEEGDSGAISYHKYCVGCHGVAGDGNGPAALHLDPKPRDFTKGLYKFHASVPGHAVSDSDVVRTITRGLHGTSMPSWRLLPEHERYALARYVKGFFREWENFAPAKAITYHQMPFDFEDADSLEAAKQHGELLYHRNTKQTDQGLEMGTTCWACHPGYLDEQRVEELIGAPPGADYLPAVAKPDVWDDVIKPPDFRTDTLKSVESLEDLYRVISVGVTGTAMPSWSILSPNDLWSLVLYVDSLRPRSIVNSQIAALRRQEEEY